ncbi:Terpene cyclase ascF [Cladobotryum mycophilum]|uniref:Terpene cyclase ascF n=1 Tax=Cladobotryum mycophilum TaxID=491253 RepID=A0ABR0SAV1_9HYPO
MGSNDIPPPSAPTWLIPVSTGALACGMLGWLGCYVLMIRRSLATKATPMPIIALGLNLSWEVVYAGYVTEMPIEMAGFVCWLAFNLGVLYATLKTARYSFASSPLVARNVGLILGVTFAAGLVINYVFARWWFLEPHRGYGDKTGKSWKGSQARDATELAYWTAGVAQIPLSVGSIAMLLQRGHSGGHSYAIWFCRFFGTAMGLPVTNILMWYYWPEAHQYVFEPMSLIIVGTSLVCDLVYPFVLAYVRSTERILPDRTVIAGDYHSRAVEDKTK